MPRMPRIGSKGGSSVFEAIRTNHGARSVTAGERGYDAKTRVPRERIPETQTVVISRDADATRDRQGRLSDQPGAAGAAGRAPAWRRRGEQTVKMGGLRPVAAPSPGPPPFSKVNQKKSVRAKG